MPQIPTFESQVEPHLGGTPTASPSAMGEAGAALEQAGGQIHAAMADFNNRYQDARRSADLGNQLASFTQQAGDAQFKWSKIADRQAAMNGVAAELGGIGKSVLANINDPLEREFLTREITTQTAMRTVDTGAEAFRRESSARRADLDTNSNSALQQIAAASSPAIKAHIADQMDMQFAAAAQAGWADPEDMEKARIKFHSDISRDQVLQDLNAGILHKDVSKMQALEFALQDRTQFTGLTPEARDDLLRRTEVMTNRFIQSQLAAQEHNDRLAEMRLRQAQSSTFIDAMHDFATGHPWTEQQAYDAGHAGLLTPEMYRAVTNQPRNVKDDPTVSLPMIDRANRGLLQKDDIIAGVNDGKVSEATARDLMKMVDHQASQQENHYFAYLRQGLGGFGAGQNNAVWMAAQGEWMNKVGINHEDPSLAFDELMGKYGPQYKPTFLGVPMGGIPKTIDDVTRLANGIKKQHYPGGPVSDDVAEQQGRMLKEWYAYLKGKKEGDDSRAAQRRARPPQAPTAGANP